MTAGLGIRPQELVSVGVTRFEAPFGYFLERARKGDLYRVGPTLVEIGRFSANPTTAELAGLTLEGSDLEPLGELDSAAAKEALVRLVRDYRAGDIRGLQEYVANFPPGEASEYFAWAKVNIGLKKLVRLTLVTVNWSRCDLLGTSMARLLRPLIIGRTRAATQRALDLAKTVIETEYRRR
jgi:hypothetical protein